MPRLSKKVRHQPGENVLFCETLRANNNAWCAGGPIVHRELARAPVKEHGEEAPCENSDQHARRRQAQSGTLLRDGAFEQVNQPVQDKRQSRGHHASEDQRGVVLRCKPAKNVIAQTRRPDRRGQRRD